MNQNKISIIGNPPSSGSTFLADLLDSSSFSACGPEINLFSNKFYYDLDIFKNNIYKKSYCSNFYRAALIPYYERLCYYGLSLDDFNNFLRSFDNTKELTNELIRYYLSLRGKNPNGVFFEKTPENINCIGEFLSNFDGYFIFLIRDPIYTYNSLRKRGFSPYRSILAWYFEVIKYHEYRNNPKTVLIKYEDLVQNPFSMVSNLLNKVSNQEICSKEELERKYKDNTYRKLSRKGSETWDVTKVGEIIDSNKKKINENIIKEFNNFKKMKVDSRIAEIYNLPEISIEELIQSYGYTTSYKTKEILKTKKTNYEKKLLLNKWKVDHRCKLNKIKDIKNYFTPLK